MRYSIITLGCKVNQYESQLMSEQLEQLGYTLAGEGEQADICIINSCAVTSTAEQKSRQAVHRARRENPGAVVCLTGCISQALPDKYLSFTDADVVIGNSNRELLPELISEFRSTGIPVRAVTPHTPNSGLAGCVTHLGERTRAYMKIEDGCNCFCSYCIIPYARGRVRSRSLENIAYEAGLLAKNYKEIVLTGINLTAFGRDIGRSLDDAVRTVAAVDGIERIRLGSIEADFITEPMLSALADEPKFCPQFHLSLQSGCDATLRRMNRHYSSADYAGLVNSIRKLFDNPSITTDVMVGFPGETDDEFEQSLAFVKQIGFTRTHCFIFSPREGTAAWSMPCQVPNEVKNERAARLQKTATEDAEAFMQTQLNMTHQVIAERQADDGMWEGYTRNYTAIRFLGNCVKGSVYNVFADAVCGNHCIGRVIV